MFPYGDLTEVGERVRIFQLVSRTLGYAIDGLFYTHLRVRWSEAAEHLSYHLLGYWDPNFDVCLHFIVIRVIPQLTLKFEPFRTLSLHSTPTSAKPSSKTFFNNFCLEKHEFLSLTPSTTSSWLHLCHRRWTSGRTRNLMSQNGNLVLLAGNSNFFEYISGCWLSSFRIGQVLERARSWQV